jgi:hypothetical protein
MNERRVIHVVVVPDLPLRVIHVIGLGGGGDLVRRAGQADNSRIEGRRVFGQYLRRVALRAQAAYAISNLYRSRGAVTVLGGPHARCYPEDAARYFDYVLGFTDRNTIDDVLRDCTAHRPVGLQLSAKQQAVVLPSLRERWKFVAPTIAKAPAFKVVPMIASVGCPYTCSFCIDSVIDYQPLALEQIRDDLKFLLGAMHRPCIGWHDPNFGVRFDEHLGVIEDVVPPGKMSFVAESSLSLLSEPHLKRLKHNGFRAVLPGIESWFDHGNKSKTGRSVGLEKVERISDHVNLILRYIPYVQTNFVLGLDCDVGSKPFELTKRFLDLTPGAYPAFSLFTAYGRAAPLNLELQRQGRVLPFPFQVLDSNHAMNVRPKNYDWLEFYDNVVDVTKYALSWPRIVRRLGENGGFTARWLSAIRALFSGRVKYQTTIRLLLDTDVPFRRFFEGETAELPAFYENRIRKSLGPLWDQLPTGALMHNQNAYLHGSLDDQSAPPKKSPRAGSGRVLPAPLLNGTLPRTYG